MNGAHDARRRLRGSIPTLGVLLLTAASSIAAQEVRWSGTASYARGTYVFDETTQTFSISNGLTFSYRAIEIGASLPFLLQNSQWVSQVGGVPLPTGGEQSGVVRGRGPGSTLNSRSRTSSDGADTQPVELTYRDAFEWNVGDPLASASVELWDGSGLVRSLRAYSAAKVPVRDVESGVGSGAWDVGLGGSVFASVAGTLAFADVSYWWFGDLPDLELRDGLSYGFGLSRPVGDKASLSVSYLGATAIIESMARPASLALGAGYSLAIGKSLSAGVALGLSESAPNLSAYLGWSLALR